MKNKNRLIIVFIIIVAMIVTVIYAVTPEKDIKYYTNSKKELLLESLMSISGIKIKGNTFEMTCNEDELNKIFSSITDLKEYRIVLNKNKVDIYIPIVFMKIIKTNIKISFDVETEAGSLKLTIKESRLGKVIISNKDVMKYINVRKYGEFNVAKKEDNIYVSNVILKFNKAFIINSEFFVKCTFDIKGILNR